MNDMKYLIISQENFCVYTWTSRVITANALIAGDGDSMIRGVTVSNCISYNTITDRDMFVNKVYQINNHRNELVEVPLSNVTDSWKEKQQLLRYKQDAFWNWESNINASLARTIKHTWDSFDVVAQRALESSNPTTGEYSILIQEYARTLEQPVELAYKELKLRIDSDNITKFRVSALEEKWKNKINACLTKEEIELTRQAMVRELWLNSLI